MHDLSTNTSHELVLPLSTIDHKKALSIFDSIRSFEDLKREFLLVEGLSPKIYRNYLQAVKRFYEFTGGLHPLQVSPADIERFYNYVSERVDCSTAVLRVAGLKKFYAGIKRDVVISLHLFRRTYVTCLYRAGMGIKAIQSKTRHASIGTLVKHYIYEVEDATPYLEKLIS